MSDKNISDLLSRCNYKYKDLTKRDILQTIGYFKDLSVKIDKFVFNSGIVKELVCLNGTVPVSYKNNVYNIPIQVFIQDNHPYEAPICYVRPTVDMNVNVSETVDSNGRIFLPYLNAWDHLNSDLFMLINIMTSKFSEQTPLYSKVNRPSSATYSPGTATATVSSNVHQYPGYNQPTPYPLSNPGFPIQSNSMPSYQPPYQPSYQDHNLQPYGSTPYPTNNPYHPMPNSQPISHLKSGLNSNIGQVRPNLSMPNYNSPPQMTTSSNMYADDTIKPEHYRMSLISAVADKMRLKFQEIYDEKKAEIDSLKRVKCDLENSEENLKMLINDAENESAQIKNLTSQLKSKKVLLNESINRMKHRDNTSIEDAVVTTTPLYRQLLQLFAEEMSIQDFIFYLSEGLTHKTISLENFLKQVRFLTRKQFILRATMQKAREQAALPL